MLARSEAGVATGAARVAAGATSYASLAGVARPALIDGVVGVAVFVDGRLERTLGFLFVGGGRIAVIDIVTDPARLARLDVVLRQV